MHLQTEPNSKTFKTELYIKDSKKDKLTEIMESRKKPFWVPSENTDLFVLGEMLNEEKIQMKIQKNEQNYTHIEKDGLINIRKYRVDNKMKLFEEDRINEAKSAKNLLDKFHNKRTLMSQNLNVSTQFSNSNITSKIKMLNDSRSIRNFIAHTKDIILAKYQLDVKKERLKREEESYNNELEAAFEKLSSMRKNQNLFENDFNKIEVHIRVLRDCREKEKHALYILVNEKIALEVKIKNVENKIIKIKEENLDKYGNFKNFIMCVKNQILFIPDDYEKESDHLTKNSYLLTEDNLNSSGYLEKTDKKRNTRNIRNSFAQGKLQNDHKLKFITNNDSIMNMKETSKIYHNEGIPYNDHKDFLEDFSKLENDNVKLVKKCNYNQIQLIRLKQDISKSEKQESDKMELKQKEFDKQFVNFSEIKNKN